LFSGKCNWLYPIPILAAVGALAFIKSSIPKPPDNMLPSSPLLAALVFVVWILVVPANPSLSGEFSQTRFSASPVVTIVWIGFRIFGSVVVAPVIEEIAFRGTLFSVAKSVLKARLSEPIAQYLAVLLAAVLFGMVHEDVFAGLLAGDFFGVARMQRDQLWGAIFCHDLSNLLIYVYVLTSDNWSYWM
jgi:uncharacterized protein